MSKILIINYSDTNSEMEKVKNLLSFEGNVKIVEGSGDFIKASIDESPGGMQYVLIERMARALKTITRTTVGPTGNIRIEYSDGTSEVRSDDHLEAQKFDSPDKKERPPFPSAWTEEEGPEEEADDSMRHWVDDEEEDPEDEEDPST